MMNFLNNMNLLPKNFIVANIVEVLKEDPDNGVEKLYEMSGTFITDSQIKAIIGQIKGYYDSHPSIKRYVKNMIYNTNKTCLNHFLQNIAVKELWEGLSIREQMSQKYSVNVPHSLVINIGMNCSLACKGCLCKSDPSLAMPLAEIDRLVAEARELGIHIIVLTGGDPLMNDSLFKVYEKYDDMEFIVLTNGVLLNDQRCLALSKLGNVLPLVTLEGGGDEIKQYIEPSTYQEILASLDRMKAHGILFGVMTPTKQSNLKFVTSDDFILPLIRKGSRMNWYVTTSHGAPSEQLGANELSELEARISFIRQTRPYVTIVLESGNQFICRCVVGPLLFHYDFNGQHNVLFFPQLSVKNSQNQPLIQVLRKIQS